MYCYDGLKASLSRRLVFLLVAIIIAIKTRHFIENLKI